MNWAWRYLDRCAHRIARDVALRAKHVRGQVVGGPTFLHTVLERHWHDQPTIEMHAEFGVMASLAGDCLVILARHGLVSMAGGAGQRASGASAHFGVLQDHLVGVRVAGRTDLHGLVYAACGGQGQFLRLRMAADADARQPKRGFGFVALVIPDVTGGADFIG